MGLKVSPMTIFSHVEFDNHEMVHFIRDAKAGLSAIVAVHDATIGPGLGGLRMYNYASDDEAVTDVLRLSRGMTYKNALAGISYGGGKAVIIGDPRTDKSEELLKALGKAIDKLGGSYITAEDVGTTVADMDIIRTKTAFARGTTKGVGDPSPFTARGVRHAIHSAARARFNKDGVRGLRVAIQGLGSVGYALAEMLHADGAILTVADVDKGRVKRAVSDLNATRVEPDEIYMTTCDIFSPCAMGASINDDTIPRLDCGVVCGAANNQLARPEHGRALQDKMILYVPDFVANAGGVINIALEGTATNEEIMARVDAIGETVGEILRRASTTKLLPNDVAEALARERIAKHQVSSLAA